ncbi:MAG: type IV toxin-antitoxin system AbiEi family antitoxin domain-containing protein [Actinomycetota bacterium]
MAIDRRDLRRRLFSLAAQQGGYFTAAEAKRLGYSYQAQAYHVDAGNWHRIDRGLFRLAEWVPDLHDDLRRWTVWSKDRASVSHETALSVHGVGEFESAHVHLTVPPGFTMHDDAVVIHHADLPDMDVMQLAGFRVTTVARALVDVAAEGADEEQLARAIEDATDAGLITLRQLRARAEAVDPKGALRMERSIHALEVP